mgnify:CR=1 FL=1
MIVKPQHYSSRSHAYQTSMRTIENRINELNKKLGNIKEDFSSNTLSVGQNRKHSHSIFNGEEVKSAYQDKYLA